MPPISISFSKGPNTTGPNPIGFQLKRTIPPMHILHFIQTPIPDPIPQTPIPQNPVHEYKRNQSLLGKNPILSSTK